MPFITRSSNLRLCYAQDGARCDPAVLLLHGIGCQLVQWPSAFVAGLVNAGYRVIRIDNRDVGLSSQCDHLGQVDMAALAAFASGGEVALTPPYSLHDMAADAAFVLDYLGLAHAHVIGVSMGGMIGQRMAIDFPTRVRTLTSIMSSSGARGLPQGDPAAVGALASTPASTEAAAVIDAARASWDIIGGPHHKSTEVGIGRSVAEATARCHSPAGFLRQFAAIASDLGRADALAQVHAPTLVIHGDCDPLVPLAAGQDTAARIPGAELHVVPTMGHDLPDPLLPALLERLLAHLDAHTQRPDPDATRIHNEPGSH